MKCDCKDCAFRGMELCEHRKMMDEINRLKATIKEAKSRMTYYFGQFGGTFPDNPQMQNVYDVLCRDEERAHESPRRQDMETKRETKKEMKKKEVRNMTADECIDRIEDTLGRLFEISGIIKEYKKR